MMVLKLLVEKLEVSRSAVHERWMNDFLCTSQFGCVNYVFVILNSCKFRYVICHVEDITKLTYLKKVTLHPVICIMPMNASSLGFWKF